MANLTLFDDGHTAVIEAAQACGLHLLPRGQRNPLHTTTSGVGEMLIAAVNAGATRLIVGIGGSSTNDGGMGMLNALGWRFLDAQDRDLPPTGASLEKVQRIIEPSHFIHSEITVACDVTNPLFGPHGAAYTFAPQKGASSTGVAILDAGLQHYAGMCATYLGADHSSLPGAGAAGGLGFALLAFLHAHYRSGAEIAIAVSGLEAQLRDADLCLTGEGCTDAQTAYGKLPAAVAACCLQAGVPCVCLSGALGKGWRELYAQGFTGIFSLAQRPQPLKTALLETAANLADAAEAITRVFMAKTRD